MILNVLLGLHVIAAAMWFGLAVSFRARPAPHRGFLALQAMAALLAIVIGGAVAGLERPGMASLFGRLLMVGAGVGVLAGLLMAGLVIWPTVAASSRAIALTKGETQRMILAERAVAVLLLIALTLMALAHRL